MLETFHVSGNTPTAVRSRELDAFAQSKRSLVTNARCLTEGVDVPNIDCVLFADPRKSTIDIVQAVGRALRTYEGKQFGYVIVPVLLDNGVIDIKSSQSKAFDSILMVLRALAANDERIIEYFRTVSQGRQWTGGTIPVEIDIPEGLVVDADEFINSIKLQFWSRLAKLSWRPFEEAREFVQTLELKSREAWKKYYRGEIPERGKAAQDIPSNPNEVYRDERWIGWGDWLGTGTIAPSLRQYRPFKEAQAFVHTLKLKNVAEWEKYCQGKMTQTDTKLKDIPSSPQHVYKKKGWKSWGDWLGTDTIAPFLRQYLPFKEARALVHTLKLKSQTEWNSYCSSEMPQKGTKPSYIPVNPRGVYKNKGWTGWGDWLGTGTVATFQRQYRTFNEARTFVCTLGLKNQEEWRRYCQNEMHEKGNKPADIPSDPARVYKDHWKSMGDWLGTGSVHGKFMRFRAFSKARKFVRSLRLRNQMEWKLYCHGKMPNCPEHIYKDKGWIGWGDWLGTGTIAPSLRQYRPFSEARVFVRALGLKSSKEWEKYSRGEMLEKGVKPDDIPYNARSVYKKEWRGFGDWLGTGTIAPFLREYRSFFEARAFVHNLELASEADWHKYIRGEFPEKDSLPIDMPRCPDHVYKNKGWVSMSDWLGKIRKVK
jgi:hypothetical protein